MACAAARPLDPLRDVTRVRPIRLLWAIYVIEWRGGRPLLVWTGASGRTGRLAPALDALGDRAPHVDLTVGPLLRFSARTAERFDAMSPHSANG